jgi:hypothetical protein
VSEIVPAILDQSSLYDQRTLVIDIGHYNGEVTTELIGTAPNIHREPHLAGFFAKGRIREIRFRLGKSVRGFANDDFLESQPVEISLILNHPH